jgi:hypothetical protein
VARIRIQGNGRKSDVKRQPLRQRRKQEDNVNMHLTETGCGGESWMELAQDHRLFND